MKITNILLIFALFIFANASDSKFEFASVAELSEIKADAYGKSLLETISLALQKNGSVNEVQKLLDDLLFKLEKDQEAATAAWNIENARLKAKIARLAKEIEELRVEIDKLKRERAKYLKLIIRVKKNLVQYKQQLAEDHTQVTDLTKTRGEDAADFKRSQTEHMDIINAISEVVKELRKLSGSISGKNMPSHIAKISQEKRDALQKSFVEITQDDQEALEFIEMATEADQKSLNKLIALLNKLKKSTEKSYNDDVAAEKKSKSTFMTLIVVLNKDIKKLESMIVTSEKNLKAYQARVAKITVEIASKTALRNSKISERKATIIERETKEKQYLSDKAERENEMKIIRRLQKIVKERLANMSKYLKSQTGA